MNTNIIDRDAAIQDIKDTAAEASHHSSGDVLNQADPNSKYAHGKLDRTGSVDGNTSMPTARTTVDGAYSIGNTSTAGVASNYQNKFSEPATHTVGSGSRTVEPLQEHVQDLGTTVQTERTRHVIQTESEPVQYIAPQTGVTTGTTTQTSRTGGHLGHTTGLPAGESGVVHHHGLVGQNQTLDPSNAQYNLNASSGAAVGTSMLGMPHGTTGTRDTSGTHSTVTDTTTHTHGHGTAIDHGTSGTLGTVTDTPAHIHGHGTAIEHGTFGTLDAGTRPSAYAPSGTPSHNATVGHDNTALAGSTGIGHGNTTGHGSAVGHDSTVGHDGTSTKPQKESLMSKIKHALHK